MIGKLLWRQMKVLPITTRASRHPDRIGTLILTIPFILHDNSTTDPTSPWPVERLKKAIGDYLIKEYNLTTDDLNGMQQIEVNCHSGPEAEPTPGPPNKLHYAQYSMVGNYQLLDTLTSTLIIHRSLKDWQRTYASTNFYRKIFGSPQLYKDW